MAPTDTLWKGKAKAPDPDISALNPTITYRHLALPAAPVPPLHPLRAIALCDMDAFYAACEVVRLGLDPAVPLVTLQWQSIIAVSYPARAFGITRMMKIDEARKRCPGLVVQHVATYREGEREPGYWPIEEIDTRTHKVSLDHYRRESQKIIALFKESLPTGEIEKASIDEAFIDFTRPALAVLLQRYPHLAHVPPSGPDTPLPPPPRKVDWTGLGTVVPVHPEAEHPASTDNPAPSTDKPPSSTHNPPSSSPRPAATESGTAHESEGDAGPSSPPPDDADAEDGDEANGEEDDDVTWHDVVLAIAAELMAKIRADIHAKLGYTTSAGIARNKFLAKLSASYKKPNNQSILRNAAIPAYLRPMAFQKIRFLGGKLGDAIAKEYDVSTVGDLLTISLDEMQRKFGEDAIWVYEVLRGIDRSEVKEKAAVNKSMLASKNLPTPITRTADGAHWLRVLAAELALRLGDARRDDAGLWPRTIVLHARQGYEAGRSKQAPFPFVRELTVDYIAHAAEKLWKELVPANAGALRVTSVQLAFTGVGAGEAGQRSIEGFFAPSAAKRPREDEDGLDDAGPGVRDVESRRAEGETAEGLAHQQVELAHQQAGLAHQQVGLAHHADHDDQSRSGSELTSFTCKRCSKRIALPEPRTRDDAAAALKTLRVEHDDFHFAQDLARAGEAQARERERLVPGQPAAAPPAKKKKVSREPAGIARFFTQKPAK